MIVHLTPEIEERLERLANETGRTTDEFVQDALAGYLDDLAQIQEMLDSRYDEMKSGTVERIPGEDIEAYFTAKSATRRVPR